MLQTRSIIGEVHLQNLINELLLFLFKFISLMFDISLDHFTVVDLVPWPSSECKADGDLVLSQTSFTLFWTEIVLEKY